MEQKSVPVVVELPTDWFRNPIDGTRHRIFLTNVLGSLSKAVCNISVRDIPWGNDFVKRIPVENGLLFSFHSVGSVAGVWRLKEAAVPPLYAIDRTGHSGWSEIANSPDLQETARSYDIVKSREVIQHYKNNFLKNRCSKYDQPASTEALPSIYVFIPLQIQSDPVVQFANIDVITLVTEAARVAKERGIHVVVKRHPFCNSAAIESLLAETVESNPFFHVSNGNIHTLIEHSLSVIAVNSGVGLEALIHGKAVYGCGLSEWYPASHQITTPEQIEQAFHTEQPAQSDASISYVGYLLAEYWVDGLDYEAVCRRIKNCLEEAGQQNALAESAPEKMQDEQIVGLRELGQLGEMERQLSQSTADMQYFRQKLERLEKENAKLSHELTYAEVAFRAADNVMRDKITQITAMNEIVSSLNELLADNEQQMKEWRSHPIRSAVKSLINSTR